MLRIKVGLLAVALTAALLVPATGRAQFRNNGIYLPQLGYMSLELFGLNDGDPMGDFGSTDAGFFGVGGLSSIGYNFWATYRLWVGFSLPSHNTLPAEPKVLTMLNVIPGIRYNFLNEEIRPYAEIGFHYLWFLYGYEAMPKNNAFGQPMYGAPRLAAGLEWYFYEEMSLSAEVAGELYITIGTFLAPGVTTLVAYTVYY